MKILMPLSAEVKGIGRRDDNRQIVSDQSGITLARLEYHVLHVLVDAHNKLRPDDK